MSSSTILLGERLLLIAASGGAGAAARYLLARWIMILTGGSFPWGTLAVNVIGCGLFGFVLGMAELRGLVSERARLCLLVGFLGAFTTFSSYAYESMVLFRERQWVLAVANVAAQNVLGLAAFALAFSACRWQP